MRVALDVTPLAGPRTGIGTFVAHLIDALAALDHGPAVVPWALTGRGGGQLPPGTARYPYPARVALPAWGRIGRPSGRATLRRSGTVAGPPSVVHGTNFVAPPTRWPTVLTVHDLSFLTTRPAFVPVVRRLVRAGAWVHAPSEAVAERVRAEFTTDRVAAVHHGPTPVGPDDPAVVVPDLPRGTPFVLAVGTAEPRKNLPALVLAFGAVQARVPDLHLVLAGARRGDPAELARIDAAVDALPRAAGARVHLLGHVSVVQRDALYRRAQVLAYPSLDEGFGFPLLEAMQVGLPVVAGRSGAVAEVAGDAAALVDPHDLDALAAALADVTTDDVRRRRLSERGHANLARFSWRSCAEGLVALYGRAS